MKATKQQFKPIYLYSEDTHKKEYLRLYDNSISELNKLIQECETVICRKLTDAQKEKIAIDGVADIHAEIESYFEIPNATKQFNLDALGVDLSGVEEQDLKCILTRGNHSYKLLKGIFVRDEKETQRIKKRYEVYTDNIDQNNYLEFCLTLEKIFNKAVDGGLISDYNLLPIVNVIAGFELTLNDNGEGYLIRANRRVIRITKCYIHN